MSQYVETIDKDLIEELQAKMNAHLSGVDCKTVVNIMKHLIDDKWAIDSDLVIEAVGDDYKVEREQQIGEFIKDNVVYFDGNPENKIPENMNIYYIEYDNDIAGGYKEQSEEQ